MKKGSWTLKPYRDGETSKSRLKLRFLRKSRAANPKSLSEYLMDLSCLLVLSFCFVSTHSQWKIGYRARWTAGLHHYGCYGDWYPRS